MRSPRCPAGSSEKIPSGIPTCPVTRGATQLSVGSGNRRARGLVTRLVNARATRLSLNKHHRGCGAHLSMPRRIPGTPALILRGGGRHTVLSPGRAEPGQAPGHPAQDPVGIHQPWGPRATPQTCSSPISTSLPGPGPPDLLLLGPSPTALPPPTSGCRPPYPPSTTRPPSRPPAPLTWMPTPAAPPHQAGRGLSLCKT